MFYGIPRPNGHLFLEVFFFKIFECSGQHQLDSVELVYFTCTGIKVDCDDVGFRVSSSQLLDYAFSYYMVRQAGKGLCADNVSCAAVDQFQHLAGQEPAFSGLISDGNDFGGHFCQILNVCRRSKVFACGKCPGSRTAQPLHSFDSQISDQCFCLLESQMGDLEVLVVEAVLHKVDQIRNDCFGSLCLQQIYQMVVGGRQEFYQDLAYDTYTGLLNIENFNIVKVVDNVTAELPEFPAGRVSLGYKFPDHFHPFPVNRICSTGPAS